MRVYIRYRAPLMALSSDNFIAIFQLVFRNNFCCFDNLNYLLKFCYLSFIIYDEIAIFSVIHTR